MSKTYCKEFEVRESTTESMWYRITVYFRGELVGVFEYPTMDMAKKALSAAGYYEPRD